MQIEGIGNLCYWCFEKMGKDTVCPHCGHEEKDPVPAPQALRLGTILGGHYLAGRMLKQSTNGITYLSYDLNRREKCILKEYFPKGIVARDKNTVRVLQPENQAAFLKETASIFLKAQKAMNAAQIRSTFRENGTVYFVTDIEEKGTPKQDLITPKPIPENLPQQQKETAVPRQDSAEQIPSKPASTAARENTALLTPSSSRTSIQEGNSSFRPAAREQTPEHAEAQPKKRWLFPFLGAAAAGLVCLGWGLFSGAIHLPTPTPTATETSTPTATETSTPTATETSTPTATETSTPTATETSIPTATETSTPTATETSTPTATETSTPTATETSTPTATETSTPTATETPIPTATETFTPQAEVPSTQIPAQVVQPELCRQQAEQGDADAQNQLGSMYEKGIGVQQDLNEAVKWYRKAADQGYAPSQYNLGGIYHKFLYYEDAVKWYQKAAQQEYAEAQISLGFMYYQGYGVEKDYEEAVKWYQKAADQGYAPGQYSLGVFYKNGYGVEQDYAEAVKWYRKAADQGYAEAACSLGDMYLNGYGVEQDTAEAVKWLQIAASHDNKSAQDALTRLGAAPF